MSTFEQEKEESNCNCLDNSVLENELEALSLNELKTHISRCKRLLQYRALLDRLPDKGQIIKDRFEWFVSEERRRERNCSLNSCNQNSSGETLSDDVSTSQHDTNALAIDFSNNIEIEKGRISHYNQIYELQLMEKYKDREVAVEATVRRAFGSTLSETEIAKILNSVPNNYFLTYRQTCERAKETIEQMRENELQCLLKNVEIDVDDKICNNNRD